MGAFDRIAETAREAKERVSEMTDRVIESVKGAAGQRGDDDRKRGDGETQQARGRNSDDGPTVGERIKGAAQDLKERAGGVVEGAMATGEKMRQAIGGEADVLEMLHRDHELVDGIFAQIEAVKGKGDEVRESLFAQLKYELGTHAVAEENLFYTALRKNAEARELIGEAFEEHKLVKQLLAELAGMPGGPEWEAKLTVLKENVQHHVKEEESEIFKVARAVLTSEQLQTMGPRFEQEKQRLAAAGKPDEADDAKALRAE